jgi:TRAP-type C4-dicarboxylate transport system permease small subunit
MTAKPGPATMLDAYSAILKRLATLSLWLAGAGLVAMTALVAWQVFGRYVLNATPTWTEPSVLLLMSWFILLGAAVGVRDGQHLGFEIGLHYAPGPLRFLMQTITESVVIGFGLAMFWYGWELAKTTWAAATPMIGISQGWDYVPMSGAGILIALFGVEKLARLFTGRPLVDAAAAPSHGGA